MVTGLRKLTPKWREGKQRGKTVWALKILPDWAEKKVMQLGWAPITSTHKHTRH